MKNNKKLRVVIDTNVFVSALMFGGKPREVVDIVIEDATVVFSQEILTELRRIIHAKFPDFLEDLQRFEKLLKRDGQQVELGSVRITTSRDPDDNTVIETAVVGKCQFIVSGDKDLLTLDRYEEIKIVKPAELLKHIES